MEDIKKIQEEMKVVEQYYEELVMRKEKAEREAAENTSERETMLNDIEKLVTALNDKLRVYVCQFYNGDYTKMLRDIVPNEEYVKCKIPSSLFDIFFW